MSALCMFINKQEEVLKTASSVFKIYKGDTDTKYAAYIQNDGKVLVFYKTINNDYPLCTDLSNSYFPRFYLSFENSFCAGYVTEKFYKALSIDIVPIGNDSTVVKLLKVS